MNCSGVETMLGVSGQVTNTQQTKNFLNREYGEIINLAAGIHQRLRLVTTVFQQFISKKGDRLSIRYGFSFKSFLVQDTGSCMDREGRFLAHHRMCELDAPLAGVTFNDFGLAACHACCQDF